MSNNPTLQKAAPSLPKPSASRKSPCHGAGTGLRVLSEGRPAPGKVAWEGQCVQYPVTSCVLPSSTYSVSAPKAEQQALESRARNLSLNYNFVTPFTAMVVTKPEGQEQSQVVEKPTEEGGWEHGVLACRLVFPSIA